MLFHMDKHGKTIAGWLSPDNPAAVPRIRIIRPDGTVSACIRPGTTVSTSTTRCFPTSRA
jgi:hypothetical protein